MSTGTQAVTENIDLHCSQARLHAREHAHQSGSGNDFLRQLYLELREDAPSPAALGKAHQFLLDQLQATDTLSSDLPDGTGNLSARLSQWIIGHTEQVGHQYREYLLARQSGAPRQFFTNRSHALYFLQAVAPTKLVDGAWLYGLLQRWQDSRFESLIRIYLEELGDGLPDKNHVLLYRQLLATHGLRENDSLSDGHYVQGTIQLALACHAEHFLPELIGYNLGYEQLPLHLLITSYELNELGIDPYYFTLHVTVDNAGTGHAQKALQGLLDTLPQTTDSADFYRRVRNGYLLNELGESSVSVAQSFDLQEELVRCLANKSQIGRFIHSDYCRLAGRTVNDWLSEPTRIPDFLKALEAQGWIRRHRAPEESRFWQLIHGERAEMFGVFSEYEQQLIHDWIVGDINNKAPSQADPGEVKKLKPRHSFRTRQRLLRKSSAPARDENTGNRSSRPLLRQRHQEDTNDFNQELRQLEEELLSLSDKAAIMDRLVPLLSPASHHKPAGLMATRIFAQLFS